MSRRVAKVQLSLRGEPGLLPAFLPVSVIDARGLVVGSVAARLPGLTLLSYEAVSGPLFARLSLPSGATETQVLQTPAGIFFGEVAFDIGEGPSTDPRMAWSATRLDARRRGGTLLSLPGMTDAWFQLWEMPARSGEWRQAPLGEHLSSVPKAPEAMQLDLRPSENSRALVLRLNHDIPQVVALARTSLSVLVTSQRTLSGAITPRVIVGGYSPNAESIMDFMRIGKLAPVDALLEPDSDLALGLLHDKIDDPIAATAAAYYLLRRRDWERLPLPWLDNLAQWNPAIPDARLIYAMTRIGRGMPMDEAAELAAATLSGCLSGGLPLFSEASTLLGDLLALAGKSAQPLSLRLVRMLRTMISSVRPAGLSFGFAGKSPDHPIPGLQAFEQRQAERSAQKLAEAQRLPDVFKVKVEWPTLDISPPSRGLRTEIDSVLLSVDRNRFLRPAVSGSAANTLFLQDVLNESPGRQLQLPDQRSADFS